MSHAKIALMWLSLVAALAALALLADPALAQSKPRMHRIAVITPSSSQPEAPRQILAFRQALRELGYVEGQNTVLELRFAEGRSERIPELVADVLARNVDVLVAGSTVTALAAKKATSTVPIVFTGVIDPVGPGLVQSLARPGGNVTGATFGVGGVGFAGKWLELLREVQPTVLRVAVLRNADNPASASMVEELRRAAVTFKISIEVIDAGDPAELDRAFASIDAAGVHGLVVTGDPFFFVQRAAIAQFAARKRLPAVYFIRDFVEAGGLLSYGSTLADSWRRGAIFVDRILKGAKPAELPVDQPTTFELVVNLQAARALGIAIPPALLLRADQVIQ